MESDPPAMRRLSSRMTVYYKRVFPILFFGIILFVTATMLLAGRVSKQFPPAPLFIVPAGMAVFAYFMMKTLVFDLVDEVWDAGGALIVRNRNSEERIVLSDIRNVSYSILVNPPRVTLSLRRESGFGNEVTFCPLLRFRPFAKSPIIDELIERIDAARQR
ncbi:MAG TPA: hypothetical protein VNH44_13610 [Micropepsaceae bacterium]|nr:hypothetical protein [Micropepsaceae bacterium]